MAIKKSDLYKHLWESCNQLRGGMDASQYKNYILTLLFVKYVSDKYEGKQNAVIVVPERGSFTQIQNLQGKDDIGNGINKALAALKKENDNLKEICEVDFNDADKFGGKKDMVDCLSGLVGKLAGLQLGKNRAGGDDLLGDAYEYLMRNFATESGKSKGEFYTPAEVSRIMAKIIGVKNAKPKNTVYDPTCGSGSLLLKVADESPIKLSLYGQEKDVTTAALAKMNMILHNNETADIRGAGRSTLSNPEFPSESEGLKRFDFVVANPPFSLSSWRNGMDPHNDEYGRFAYGVPPAKNGDYAFLLHILKSINSDGAGAVIMPHGVLFRGNVEGEIRRKILRQGFIAGVIGLPPNLFYGTGIPACIVVINKRDMQKRKGVFMVDAADGFIKDGPKNRLRAQDIHKIVDVFTKQKEIAGYSRLVPMAEIEANGHNLNLPRYIVNGKGEDRQSLAAHLHGGIPQEDINALAGYWKIFPNLRRKLFCKSKDGRLHFAVETEELRDKVLQAAEVLKFADALDDVFAAWQSKQTRRLEGLNAKTAPKDIIFTISEALLAAFADKPLLDPYAVYQLLMDYWSETMEDDVYRICDMGWREAAQPEPSANKANLQIGNGKNASHYACDLIPPELLAKIYFAQEQDGIADQELNSALLEKYGELSEGDVKDIVLEQKWFSVLRGQLKEKAQGVALQLVERLTQLQARYASPLPQLEAEAKQCIGKVEQHIKELLTSKTRLPGFSGKWELFKMGNLGKLYGGLSNKTKSDFQEGNSLYVPFINVMNNVVVDVTNLGNVRIQDNENQKVVKKGDLLFTASSETPREVGMCAVMLDQIDNLYLNSFCFGFRIYDTKKVSPLFLSYLINSDMGRLLFLSIARGTTRYNLSKADFSKIQISLPPMKEQTAITNLLTDMDAKTAAQERLMEKAKYVKIATMQELLTGKTRLPANPKTPRQKRKP